MSSSTTFVVVIPARHGSTRLPGKPLRLLAGEPLVVHVARRALATGALQVVLATDDARIAEAVKALQVDVAMTRPDHLTGSDRLAECAACFDWPDDRIVVNLQGDEPFVPQTAVQAVVDALAGSDAAIATLATPITDAAEMFNPNVVKVVCDRFGYALYFSRAPIPWARDTHLHDTWASAGASEERLAVSLPRDFPALRHIGIYAYRAGFLRRFTTLDPTPLERTEALEQLRAIEHGYRVRVALSPEALPPGVDTEDDLARAEVHLRSRAAD